MRVLLIVLLTTLTAGDVFSNGMTLAPGLSLKNLFMYSAAAFLLLRVVLGERIRVEMRGVHIAFCTLIGYALLTILVGIWVVDYPQYYLVSNLALLKTNFVDWLVLFLVFFYGCRTREDVNAVLKALLALVGIAHVLVLGMVFGLVDTGAISVIGGAQAEASRVNGVFGEANDTANFLALLLPSYVALAQSSRGGERLWWMGVLLVSVCVFLMTGSRGALVGIFVGGIWAGILLRRYISVATTMTWATRIGIGMIPLLIAGGVKYWYMFTDRFINVSLVSAADVSSGRTDLWMNAINKMMQVPSTLLTGFGWNTWQVQVAGLVAHNEYLWLWFELGLVGLFGFIAIWASVLRPALRAIPQAEKKTQRLLIAFVFGSLSLLVSICFAIMYKPMLYIWPYVGLMMRYVVLTRDEYKAALEAAVKDKPRPASRSSGVRRPARTRLQRGGVSRRGQ